MRIGTYTLLCLLGLVPNALAGKDISEVAERAMPSVIRIVVYDATGSPRGEGSGFFIGPGQVITNAHVIEDAYSAEIFSENEYYQEVTVLKADHDVDLALLSVDNRSEPVLALEQEDEIRPGQRIIAIGNPMGLEKTLSDGLVSAVRTVPGKIQIIQISAPISPGSSGGPVMNFEGRVIGIAMGSLVEGQNLNFAIGTQTIASFLGKGDDPRKLRVAKSRVLSRVVWKWTKRSIVYVIALALGPGWWILIIAIMILYAIWLGLRGACGFLTKPLRRASDNTANIVSSSAKALDSPPFGEDECSREEGLSDEIEHGEDDENAFIFYCWKCGAPISVDRSEALTTITCEDCGAELSIPEN